ncbi:MAG TPA: CoA transferase, partial [Dehalococcoidia bacterium]|nr:CoA transferase [Dehalococcoidia bacterium]
DRAELATDPRYATTSERIARRSEVDQLVDDFTRQYPRRALIDLLDQHEVPIGPVYSIEDIFEDPHYWERGTLVNVEDPVFGKIAMPAIVPHLSKSPGRIDRLGPPEVGQDTDEILTGLLGYTGERIAALRDKGVI